MAVNIKQMQKVLKIVISEKQLRIEEAKQATLLSVIWFLVLFDFINFVYYLIKTVKINQLREKSSSM